MKLETFDFNGAAVRVSLQAGEPWFVAADVCRVLEIANSRDAVSGLDEDEKGVGTADTLGGNQKMTIISESGLYALVFKSRKPEAKGFRKWVTSEVLPALRKSGHYEVPAQVPEKLPTVRLEMQRLRELLLTSATAVSTKQIDVGRAQQVANLAARYLESVKMEGDACGYENVFELPASAAGNGLLQAGERKPAELLQALPQCRLQAAQGAGCELPGAPIPSEETLGGQEPRAGEDPSTAQPGAADLGPKAAGDPGALPGGGGGALGAPRSSEPGVIP